jgi:amidase
MLEVNGALEKFRDQFFWAGPASLAYLPATVAPAGMTESGLPVGVQIIGPYLGDRETIQFARLLGAVSGVVTMPPAYRD